MKRFGIVATICLCVLSASAQDQKREVQGIAYNANGLGTQASQPQSSGAGFYPVVPGQGHQQTLVFETEPQVSYAEKNVQYPVRQAQVERPSYPASYFFRQPVEKYPQAQHYPFKVRFAQPHSGFKKYPFSYGGAAQKPFYVYKKVPYYLEKQRVQVPVERPSFYTVRAGPTEKRVPYPRPSAAYKFETSPQYAVIKHLPVPVNKLPLEVPVHYQDADDGMPKPVYE